MTLGEVDRVPENAARGPGSFRFCDVFTDTGRARAGEREKRENQEHPNTDAYKIEASIHLGGGWVKNKSRPRSHRAEAPGPAPAALGPRVRGVWVTLWALALVTALRLSTAGKGAQTPW